MKLKRLNKVETYLGFAKKAGKLISGSDTLLINIKKNKVKLLIITNDTANNTKEKLINKAEFKNIPFRIYGESDKISHILGSVGNKVFGIVDEHFADIIKEAIDKE